MTEIADRYRKVAARFTETAEGVPDDAWENPAPCEGWVARDVVRHMVEWMPSFFKGNLDFPSGPSVDDDPVGAWEALDGALRAALADPETSARELDMQAGRHRVDDAIGTFILGDVLIHTWDLARATGLDETLDPDEVHDALVGMEPITDILVKSGHYGPPVPVPADADEQTRLIALSGRQP
jgi:uncharacterized protein (TIGR03086 family)